MTHTEYSLQPSDRTAGDTWLGVLPWPASVHGWTRALLIAVVGLAIIAMTHKYQTELEVAYSVHGLRAMNPSCQTIELRHEEGDIYLMNCTDPPPWTLATNS